MSTPRKILFAALLVVLSAAGIFEARQASTLRTEVRQLQQQQKPLIGQIRQLTNDLAVSAQKLSAAQDENDQLNRDLIELFKLRDKVARLQASETSTNATVADHHDATRGILDRAARANVERCSRA
jgi:outer membrane murein-binding lipoprotein Lpp